MLLVDTVEGRVIDDEELKNRYASRQPYGEWLDQYLVSLKDLKIPNKRVESYSDEMRMRLMKAFGYSYEDYRTSILNMAANGGEGTSAMGIDTRWPYFPSVISHCLTTSSSCLHRLQTRQSMRSARKLLPLRPFMQASRATCSKRSRRTVRCCALIIRF